MARKINSRLRICGILQAETPLHVGGYGVDVDTDLSLARNGENELYVPGTSIAGVLRAWCEGNFGEDLVKEIFGFQKGESGQASFILIEDAIVITKEIIDGKEIETPILTEIRDGVGINRFYGTAAAKTKFDRAILLKASKLKFEMTVEIADHEAATKTIVGHLLSALAAEEIRFGASKTRGLGRVKFELTEIREEKLIGFGNILDWFDESKKTTVSIQTLIDSDPSKSPKPKKPKLEIEICWQPLLPLMVKAGYEGIGVDMLPVTSGVEDGKLSLVLAGSSLKGAFRSHAERIVRTLKPDKFEKKEKFDDQIDGIDFVENLFGARKKTEDKNDNEVENKRKKRLGLGALCIDDCYSVESFDEAMWREVEQASVDNNGTYTTFLEKLREVEKPNLKFYPTQHTAIDRFTGGVAEGALYSVLAPTSVKWQPIKMSLDFCRTGENDKCCLMLLLLILRDLAEKRLPLGFATNRGMGEIEVQSIKLIGKNLTEIGLPKDLDIILANGDVREIDEGIKEKLTVAWKNAEVLNV